MSLTHSEMISYDIAVKKKKKTYKLLKWQPRLGNLSQTREVGVLWNDSMIIEIKTEKTNSRIHISADY